MAATAVTLGTVLAAVAAPEVASAHTASAQATTAGTGTVNADGTVTVALTGTWVWPSTPCTYWYGLGWAVDWWGMSASAAPANAFPVTDAGEVVPAGTSAHPWLQQTTTTGTVSPTGAVQQLPLKGLPLPLPYFHVGTYYAGEDTDLCATTTADGSPEGSWTAAATYPSLADVPAALCVNFYDEHGRQGKISGLGKDFSPSGDHDNSIRTKNFDSNPNDLANCIASSALNWSGQGSSG